MWPTKTVTFNQKKKTYVNESREHEQAQVNESDNSDQQHDTSYKRKGFADQRLVSDESKASSQHKKGYDDRRIGSRF